MPVIFSFIVFVIVAYYMLVSGDFRIAAYLPWAANIRSLIASNALLVQGSAAAVSFIGLLTAGLSVLYVRGKTLVIGGKKTLIVFTVLFMVTTIMLGMRVFTLLQPYLHTLAQAPR